MGEAASRGRRRPIPQPFAAPQERGRLPLIVALVVLGVVVLPTVGLMATNHLARQAVERRARIGNQQTAAALAAALGQSYRQRLAILDDLPTSAQLAQGLNGHDDTEIRAAIQPVLTDGAFCSIRLIRPGQPDLTISDGPPCWSPSPRPGTGQAVEALGVGIMNGVAYSAVQLPNIGGQQGTSLVATLPVVALLQPTTIPEGGKVIVVSGQIIAESTLSNLTGHPLGTGDALHLVSTGRAGTVVTRLPGETGQVIEAYQPVAGTRFGVFVNVRTSVAYATANHLTTLLIIGYAVFLVLAVILTLLVFGLLRRRGRATGAAERRVRALTDASPDGVVVLDHAGQVLFANPAMTAMAGVATSEELTGTRARDWYVGEPSQLDAARRALTTDEIVPDIRLEIQTPQGTTVPIEAHTAPLDLDGHRGTVSVVRNLTERTRTENALARAEARQRVTLESMAEGIVFYDVDPSGARKPVLMNPAARKLLGCDIDRLAAAVRQEIDLGASEIDGRPLAGVDVPSAVVAREGRRSDDVVFHLDGPQGPHWIRSSASPVRDERGVLVGIVATLVDLTGELTGRAEAEAERARFIALVEHGRDLVMVLDGDGLITYASPAFDSVLGYALTDVVGRPSPELVHPHDLPAVRRHMVDLIGRRAGVAEFECRVGDAHGAWHHLEVTAANRLHDDAIHGVVVNGRDVTERVRSASRLRHQATHDALTGLPNRSLLLERLAMSSPAADGPGRAALYVDLDHFKHINDSFGHGVGDQVLVALAERLVAVVRPGDTVARMGGDEFVVLAEEVGQAAPALELALRLQEAVAAPIVLGDTIVSLDTSIGVALSDGQDAETLIQQADTALYRAKANGRNRCQLFDDAMRMRARRRLVIEQLLRDAIDQPHGPGSALVVHHQPVVELTTGEVRGHEALARLRGTDGELVSPMEFIEMATDAQLIVPFGDAVLARACAQQAAWLADGRRPGPVSVNLTAQQLADPTFLDRVFRVLAANELPAEQLCLELTESSLIDSGPTAQDTLAALRDQGVRVALDDFGTGWSSLAYVRQFPIDVVKIDRTFVAGLGDSTTDEELVRAILGLGRSLGLRVVAEGVETERQAQVLIGLGCRLAQGFLFGRPAAPEDWERYSINH